MTTPEHMTLTWKDWATAVATLALTYPLLVTILLLGGQS